MRRKHLLKLRIRSKPRSHSTSFENAGVKIAEKPSDVAELLAKAMKI
jgi:succinyl-CoA synthetase alpha subunit